MLPLLSCTINTLIRINTVIIHYEKIKRNNNRFHFAQTYWKNKLQNFRFNFWVKKISITGGCKSIDANGLQSFFRDWNFKWNVQKLWFWSSKKTFPPITWRRLWLNERTEAEWQGNAYRHALPRSKVAFSHARIQVSSETTQRHKRIITYLTVNYKAINKLALIF